MSEIPFERRAIISGIGRSAIGRRLGREPLELTVDACLAAIADAGLEVADIDGLETWPGEGFGPPGFDGPGVATIQDALRLRLNWYMSGAEGLNMVGYVIDACMAVATGLARHVLVIRTITESSGLAAAKQRGFVGQAGPGGPAPVGGQLRWSVPFGVRSAVHWAALSAQRHFSLYGTTPEQLGAVAVNQRANASRNPEAIMRAPMTLDDYLASRMISTPLRLFDCDIPADGSTAFVISTAEHAPDCPNGAVSFEAVGAARRSRALWEQSEDLPMGSIADAAEHMWSRTDLRAADVDVAQLYDGFSIFTLMWLEALGFCGRGESGPFVQGGGLAADGGSSGGPGPSHGGGLPVNTAGGQLSEGRFVGHGLLYEACRQLRRDAGPRQVPGAEVAVVGVGGGVVAHSLLLSRSG